MTGGKGKDPNQTVFFYTTKLGTAASTGRPLNAAERKSILYFLSTLQITKKQRGDSMSKQNTQPAKDGARENCNVAFLAGDLKSLKVDDDRAFFLVDTGVADKWVPCTIYDSAPLIGKIRQYETGDFIKLVGFVRPWSQKKDDKWINNLDVRVTEIRSEAPQRQRKAAPVKKAPSQELPADFDDDVPF